MSPELKRSIDEFIAKNKVVVFMKGERDAPKVRVRKRQEASRRCMHACMRRWQNARVARAHLNHACAVRLQRKSGAGPFDDGDQV